MSDIVDELTAWLDQTRQPSLIQRAITEIRYLRARDAGRDLAVDVVAERVGVFERDEATEKAALICEAYARWADEKITDDTLGSQGFADTANAAQDCADMIRQGCAPVVDPDAVELCRHLNKLSSIWRSLTLGTKLSIQREDYDLSECIKGLVGHVESVKDDDDI